MNLQMHARRAAAKKSSASGDGIVPAAEYLGYTGSILWPANMTRPDISYAAAFTCQFAQCADRPNHIQACLDIVGYLVRTKHMGITYGGKLKMPMGLNAFPQHFFDSRGLHTIGDSSWGRVPRPFGGFAVMYLNAVLAWSARSLKIVPDSTCEAEIAVGSKAAKCTSGVRMILEDMRRTVYGPTALLGDNKAMYDVIIKPGTTARTTHFERATMLVKRLYTLFVLTPFLILTEWMTADIFTKALAKDAFVKFRSNLMNTDASVVLHDDEGRVVSIKGKAAQLWSKIATYTMQ